MKSYLFALITCIGLAACNEKAPPENNDKAQATSQASSETSAKPKSYDYESIKAFLNTLYQDYDPARDCWKVDAEQDGLHYCMQIILKQNTIWNKATKEESVYLVLGSELFDDQNQPSAAHVDSGLISFVHIAANEVMFSDLNKPMGVWGKPPEHWALRPLSNNGDWGWETESGDCHMGHCIRYYKLYAAIQDQAKAIADFPVSYDNGGTLAADEGKLSTLDAKVSIDEKAETDAFYHLNVAITNKLNNNIVDEGNWVLKYDDQQAIYPHPTDWPIADIAF